MNQQLPRGIRNNNPGNIRWGADWQGLKRTENRKIRPFAYLRHPFGVFARWQRFSLIIRGFTV